MKVDDEEFFASLEGRLHRGDPRVVVDNDAAAATASGEGDGLEEGIDHKDNGGHDHDFDDEEEAEVVEEYYCVACEKSFKSDKQYVFEVWWISNRMTGTPIGSSTTNGPRNMSRTSNVCAAK